MKSLGVKNIISTATVGIINTKINPGDFIIPNDFLDFTKTPQTFFNKFEKEPIHTDMTKPFSEKIRKFLIETCKEFGYSFHESGVYVNACGPRFETPAEIRMFDILGADIVGMTIVPEVVLSNELGIEYATIAIGTNYACGISKKLLTFKEVHDMTRKKEAQLKKIIKKAVNKI